MDTLAVSVLPADGRGAIVFTWLESEAASAQFVESVSRLADDELPERIRRFLFETFENIYFSPTWWEHIDATKRATLVEHFNTSIDMFQERDSECLASDGLQTVDWRVTSRESLNWSPSSTTAKADCRV